MLQNLSDKTLLWIGAFLCLIAAWCTLGYHHPDEHFQIWEFANYKLGRIPGEDLPWEFPAQMRPGLQPFLAFSMVKAASALGITNPFLHVFFMRILCAAAALWVYWEWSSWLQRDFANDKTRRLMRLGLLFFWLMPYLSVRFSSENTAAISFFGGLLLLVQQLEYQKNAFSPRAVLAGLLIALSFFFRYQMAFAFLGLGAWLLLRGRPGWKTWVALVFGASFSLVAGFLSDYWLYDGWVFAPYNYFFSNIMEGKAAEFGVSPFWWYFTEMPVAFLPPLSLILLGFASFGIWKKPWHVLSWCVVPFFLGHMVVAHKEVRFLFPMVMPFFFFAAAGWEAFREKYPFKPWMRKTLNFCFAVNAFALVLRIIIPAKEMAAYAKFLYDWEVKHPDSVLYSVKERPRKYYPMNMPFYEHPEQKHLPWYTGPGYFNDTTALKTGDIMLFTEILHPPPTPPPGFQMHRVYAYYPDWILFNNTNKWQERTRIWAVYELIKQ